MSTREDPGKKVGLTLSLPSESRSFGGVLGCHREPADARKTQWVRFLVEVRILIGVRVRRDALAVVLRGLPAWCWPPTCSTSGSLASMGGKILPRTDNISFKRVVRER